MATIITREVGTTAKGSPLTNAEIDNNFININNQITYNGPSIAPSLNLDFANSKTLDPRISFSRASTAAYYDGKTTVKAEENLLSSSSLSTGYATINCTLTANAAVAPDGTTSATKTVPTTANDRHIAYKDGGIITLSSGQVVTYSAYFKPAGYNYAALSLSSAGSGANKTVVFDITSGVGRILTDGAILFSSMTFACTQPDTNGWCRASVTAVAATAFNLGIHISACNSLITQDGPVFAGDGVSGIYVWGMQVEQRAFPTAYTPTTSSPITNYIPVLQTAASNAARIDHDPVTGECKGLLIEEQRTNLLTYSEQFDNVAWSKSNTTTTASAVIAPDGTLTGDIFAGTIANAKHELYQSFTATSGVTYTFSFYAKHNGRNIGFELSSAFFGATFCSFNLSSGTVVSGTGAAIQAVGNGWYRCSVTKTATASGSAIAYLQLTDGSSNVVFAGDGYSGVYIWGAQLEQGAFATSYIPTALTYSGRASIATYQGDDGFLATAAVNAPRYQRNAQGGKQLLLEGAGTNLFTASERLDDSAWGKAEVAVFPNSVTAPDGSSAADKIVASQTTAQHNVQEMYSGWTAGSTYTASVFAKPAGKSILAIVFPASVYGAWKSASFNLATGATISVDSGVTASITNGGNGWYRCSVTCQATATASGTVAYKVQTVGNDQAEVFAGDGSSGLYLWGAQLEAGSVATSYMPSVETFTSRSSTATYFDSTGVLRTAPANAPRYGYGYDASRAKWVSQGLLVEAAGTNLLLNSNVQGSYYNTTVTANAVAPDGTTTANTVSAIAVDLGYAANTYGSFIAGTTYTFSLFVKQGASRYVNISSNSSSVFGGQVTFDLQAGVVQKTFSGTGSIQYAGNGWYRLIVTGVCSTSGSQALYAVATDVNGTTRAAASAGEIQLYSWGAQLEVGSVATSYIPTTSAQVTRAADSATSVSGTRAADVYSSAQATRVADAASMTGTNFSSWYRGDEGSLYAEYIPNYASSGVPVGLDLNGSRSMIIYDGLASLAQTVYIGSTGVALGNAVSGATAKASAAYNLSSASSSLNGSAVASLNQSMTVPNRLCIGTENTNTNIMNGTIKKIAYYPKRLSNSELQALTA